MQHSFIVCIGRLTHHEKANEDNKDNKQMQRPQTGDGNERVELFGGVKQQEGSLPTQRVKEE